VQPTILGAGVLDPASDIRLPPNIASHPNRTRSGRRFVK
jgi:hypothetical protein